MKQNKFWLVWSPQGIETPKKRYDTQEKAITGAKNLAENYPKQDVFVLQATHHFKAEVNVIETSFEATPEESLAVEPRREFAVDDLVLFDNKLYYIINIDSIYVEIAPINSDAKSSKAVLIKDVGRVENPRTKQEYFAKLSE